MDNPLKLFWKIRGCQTATDFAAVVDETMAAVPLESQWTGADVRGLVGAIMLGFLEVAGLPRTGASTSWRDLARDVVLISWAPRVRGKIKVASEVGAG